MRRQGLNIIVLLAVGFALTACDKCSDYLWKTPWGERKPASCLDDNPQK